jgi:hypothetical protein
MTSSMTSAPQKDTITPEPPASWEAVERDSREVRAVNLILAQRVVELEDLVAELRKTIEEGAKGLRVSPDLLEEEKILIMIDRIRVLMRWKSTACQQESFPNAVKRRRHE